MSARGDAEGPEPVDIHVGSRIRMRRKIKGMSQQALADQLGITFQQVQKYERGANRVSSSKLYQVAQALEAPITYFFEGLPDPASGAQASEAAVEQALRSLLLTPEGLELARLFPLIDDRLVRGRLLDLVRALTRQGETLAASAA